MPTAQPAADRKLLAVGRVRHAQPQRALPHTWAHRELVLLLVRQRVATHLPRVTLVTEVRRAPTVPRRDAAAPLALEFCGTSYRGHGHSAASQRHGTARPGSEQNRTEQNRHAQHQRTRMAGTPRSWHHRSVPAHRSLAPCPSMNMSRAPPLCSSKLPWMGSTHSSTDSDSDRAQAGTIVARSVRLHRRGAAKQKRASRDI